MVEMTLTLKIDQTLEQRLRKQAARRGVKPNSYAVAAIQERVRRDSRPTGPMNREESKLLSQINAGLPDKTWDRYDELVARRHAQSLTNGEHRELMRITNTVEKDHARRMGLLVKLARLRNVPLESLMRQMGIGPRRRGNREHD